MLARHAGPGDPPVPGFPFLPRLLAAGPLGRPYFWARFDVFERMDGGLAMLEYNCDKPTSQREIWASAEAWRDPDNPNRSARAAFRNALTRAWVSHAGGPARSAHAPRVAILVDPSHREELHLAYLYGRELDRLGWPWDVAGPDNLAVAGGWPVAYGERVDAVIRQYPTEFLHEIPAIGALWQCALAGRLLWLNDPRAVLAQAKSSLALLWEHASRGRWLTRAEATLVRRHLPPTGLASTPGWLDRAAARPHDWVIKPVFGRFSEGVTVGCLCSTGDWAAALSAAAGQPGDWVLQAYVPPRRRWLPAAGAGQGGYVNWGVYLAGGEPAGLLARCQPTPLTAEATAWWAPLRLRRQRARAPVVRLPRRGLPPRARRPGARGPGGQWSGIADRAALEGYTNVWTDGLANFSLAAVELTPGDWDEVADATLAVSRVVGRVLSHLEGAPELLAVLGIPAALAALATRPRRERPWSFVSRLDWARTPEGWKLLEINSDTPAGLWEAGLVSARIAPLHRTGAFVGADFWPTLADRWAEAVAEASGAEAAGQHVGLVGATSYAEDLDQMRAHERAIRLGAPRAGTDIGAIGDVRVRQGRAWLHGAPVDLLFRYYPVDWLVDDPALVPLLELAASGRLPMYPPAHALIPQSKAFLALVWELHRQGFFPAGEAAAVRAYVPLTVLDAGRLGGRCHVVKPYLEREGHGVRFSQELDPRERRRLRGAEVVYQERVDLARVRLPVATARGWRDEERYLVFGVFLIGDRVAGAYTRAGAPVTGREAVFTPLVLR